MRANVGTHEQRDIEQLVAKILRDLGNPEPPLRLEQVRALLALDFKYYSTTDIGFMQEFAHRIKVANKSVVELSGRVLDVVRKANLVGLWIPDNRRILIDENLPKPKHRWTEAHEIAHSVIPWHADFLMGDDNLTLNPECHETIEAEANFGAGRLLFLGDRFHREARDTEESFDGLSELKKRYGNTLASTFWRFVEDRDPTRPSFGLISRHPRFPNIGGGDSNDHVQHFVGSKAFRDHFSRTSPTAIYAIVERIATWKRQGPVFMGVEPIYDDNGGRYEFVLEGFCNSYQLLTYGRLVKK